MRQRMGILVAHAVGFWDCRLFINAATEYQPLDFGTAGDKFQGIKEVSAFLGHVQAWSRGYGVATGGPLAWGLCYNKEMTPDQLFCDDYYKLTNYSYGQTGELGGVESGPTVIQSISRTMRHWRFKLLSRGGWRQRRSYHGFDKVSALGPRKMCNF
ncbi:hypothetical protein IGI04_020285 [Brassica rapa subsp. trilocularis]|uniref:Glycoside hydrolase family 19 catalytic domain-containing protein n=1 Tax=Brassica rapa subsp. trilocularis TaxID=1813537 RepID=A0ABQ7MKP3_BRACM|nr:hypothetical protein IGI04_020285 [Brassica rapa subsp. trilocularis]